MKFFWFRRSKVVPQTISIETIISHLKSRCIYFKRQVSEQPLFIPEYEISKEILEVIEGADRTIKVKLGDIVNIYNRIMQVDHYDGSGWHDFQILLKGYFHHYGYSVDFENGTGAMCIEKK